MTIGALRASWDPRAERLIAILRVSLAIGSLIVITFDPTQPARHWPVAYSAFVVYLLYSLVVFQLTRGQSRPWLPIVSQVIDLLWVIPVVYFTEGANTPFFPFFVVFTLNAGVRWGGWGAWAVSLYSVLVYGWLLFEKRPGELDLNNDLMRLGRLKVSGFGRDRALAVIETNLRRLLRNRFHRPDPILRMPHFHPHVQRFDLHARNLG